MLGNFNRSCMYKKKQKTKRKKKKKKKKKTGRFNLYSEYELLLLTVAEKTVTKISILNAWRESKVTNLGRSRKLCYLLSLSHDTTT